MEARIFKVWISSIYLMRGSKKERTRLFFLMLSDGRGGKGHKKCVLKIQEIKSEYRKNPFHCKDHQRAIQGAKGGWRISILETPAGHSPQ